MLHSSINCPARNRNMGDMTVELGVSSQHFMVGGSCDLAFEDLTQAL